MPIIEYRIFNFYSGKGLSELNSMSEERQNNLVYGRGPLKYRLVRRWRPVHDRNGYVIGADYLGTRVYRGHVFTVDRVPLNDLY